MAIFRCTFRSTMLMNDTGVNIILPDKRFRPLKVLYLLHGYKEHFGSWLYESSIARYVNGKDIAVVMPDGGRSFYCNMALTGENYYSYITKELPLFIKSQLGLDPSREDTAIAGLSMGGYGALKIGMSNPNKFSLIGAFSPACDIVKIAEDNPDIARAICGDAPVKDSENDLYRLTRELCEKVEKDERPVIYHYCGDSDFMIEENRAFRDFMLTKPINYSYHEEPGAHEWPLWDKWAADFVEKMVGNN